MTIKILLIFFNIKNENVEKIVKKIIFPMYKHYFFSFFIESQFLRIVFQKDSDSFRLFLVSKSIFAHSFHNFF